MSKKTKTMLLTFSIVLLAILLASCSPATPPEPGALTGRVFLDENANAECEVCDCDFYLEGITIQLYEGTCGGTINQTTVTDEEGIFTFSDLPPGEYCLSPKIKTICEGFKPTTPIQQKVVVLSAETVEVPWFGFDNNLDIND